MIVGAEIIKILFDYSDDEMVDNLMLKPHFQPALHTTSFDEQSLSGKSLSRFRRRCYDYEQAHGVDLYHDCVTGLAEASARMMGIDKRIRRMDSLMVEASIRKLSRMELIYTCISKLIRYLHKNGHDDMIGHMEHYYDPNDFEKVTEYQLFIRCLREQTIIEDGKRHLRKRKTQYSIFMVVNTLWKSREGSVVLRKKYGS